MISTYAIYDGRSASWWCGAKDGVYILDGNVITKAVGVVDGKIVFESIKCGGRQTTLLGSKTSNPESLMSHLFQFYPEYAEWLLWNPEWL